jgi:alpha-tubulin suppressor-like RCC1 family protein
MTMQWNGRRNMWFVKWSTVWIALLLIWSYTLPSVSARPASAGSWDRGTILKIAGGAYHSLALKSAGSVVAWGSNSNGQTNVPAAALSGVDAIAGGAYHSLALKSDGSVVAWGANGDGQINIPAGLSGVISVAAGSSHSLALKSDGTLVAWGHNNAGQRNVPADLALPVKGSRIAMGVTHALALKSDGGVVAWGANDRGQSTVPSSAQSGVVSVDAGYYHSLALKSDGSVVAWGDNNNGQSTVPLLAQSGVVAISAGNFYSMALKSDGSVVAWGLNNSGQSTVPSTAQSGVVAITSGGSHSLALKSDGSVVAWGLNSNGQSTVPASAQSGVVAISAGLYHSLALKSDGSVVAWGLYSQSTVPPSAQSGVVAIAGGGLSSLALKSDGSVVAWGDNSNGQTTVPPAGQSGVVAIAAKGSQSLALKSDGTIIAWGNNSYGQTTVPGSGDLSGLSLQEGAFTPTFQASVTTYTYGYIGASASSVHIVATLADPSNAALYINNQLQTSGTNVAVNVSGPSTDIPVRVEPYFLPAQTYTLTIQRDSTPPDVQFSVNGNAVPSQTADAVVTVSDTESGFVPASLQYAWTTDTGVPSSGWTSFTSGMNLTKAGADGDWYLHIQANDNLDNTVNTVSNPFLLDNTGPLVDITMTKADTSSYTDNTWTNQNITVSAVASDPSSVTSITYSLDSGATWSGYTAPFVLQNDSIHALSFKAVDSPGNETVVQRTVKISKSGLMLTPTLTKADGNAYTSGAWTNGSVTASVYAEAGASEISALTYVLDGDTAQAYANQTPVLFDQEGAHTITFQVTDTAGNSITAPLSVNIDLTAPSVSFSANGSEAWANAASTSVTVTDSGGSNASPSTLQYAWTTDTSVPSSGWTPFTSGTDLTKAGADGDWYLHSQAMDNAGNMVNTVSNRFRLDTSVAELNGLTISAGTLSPVFAGSITSYSASVGEGVSGITVTPNAVGASDTIEVSVNGGIPQTVASGSPSGQLTLAVGANTIAITVHSLNGAQKSYNVTVTRAAAPPSDSGDSSPIVTTPVIDMNGISFNPANIDTAKPSVTLEVTPKDGAAYVSIPAGILLGLEGKNRSILIEIKAPYGTYQVPVNLASLIPGLQELLAKNNLKAENISFKITLTDKSGDKTVETALANGLPNAKVLGAIVDFHIDIVNTKTGQAIGTADQFSQALTRVIPMPKSMSEMPAQWGAFRYNDTTKTFEFVPAQKQLLDGIWYVMISSYSNSVYTVAENTTSFTDVLEHWSRSFVELAGAKGLMDGVGGGLYEPDRAVTRVEFTAMLVRALGRGTSTGSAAPYDDVRQGAWYVDEVAKAKELGLLHFVKGSSFMPDQPLSREEMASMLAAVITLEKLPMTKEFVSLDGYKDIGSVDSAYLEDVRMMVKLRIMTGTGDDTFGPEGESTRAQAAVVFIRTLQALGMIE